MSNQTPNWRTSSYTHSDTCVEVADDALQVKVRDTKWRDGGTMAVPPSSWTPFVEFAKRVKISE
ncbi:DUF397 domain-containing protein [Streptomyces sp. NPDC002012]|uniref:DUF397 domain-containing protein n=1 Tax=Streptomyces sp. NPDC002012 TaxID=3154532 RepID=UPI003316B16D